MSPLGFAIDFIKYSPRWPYRPEGVSTRLQRGILPYEIAERRGVIPLGFAIDFLKYNTRWPYRHENLHTYIYIYI